MTISAEAVAGASSMQQSMKVMNHDSDLIGFLFPEGIAPCIGASVRLVVAHLVARLILLRFDLPLDLSIELINGAVCLIKLLEGLAHCTIIT